MNESKIDTFVVLCGNNVKLDTIKREFTKKLSIRNDIDHVDHENSTFYLVDSCAIMFVLYQDFDIYNMKLPDRTAEPITINCDSFRRHLETYKPGTSFYYHLDHTYLSYKYKRSSGSTLDSYLESMGLTLKDLFRGEAIIIDTVPVDFRQTPIRFGDID